MSLARPLLALALAHLTGSLLRALPSLMRGRALREALVGPVTSPASALVAVALLHGASLGLAGAPLAVALVAALLVPLRTHEHEVFPAPERNSWVLAAALLLAILARPMVPTCWDEFVWLGKARFESEGFGAGVRAALDPSAHLMPPGYPTLWPAAAGWLALGADDLGALTAGASLLVFLTLVTFGERLERACAEVPRRPDFFLAVGIVLAAPLVLVHARTTYVDLPLGLLGAALFLEIASARPSAIVAASLATLLVGLKDEGAAHLLAALVAGAFARPSPRTRPPHALLLAIATGTLALVTWQALVSAHGIGRDHGGFAPNLAWIASLPLLLVRHASEITSWGLFWPAVVAFAVAGRHDRRTRALLLALAVNLLCVFAMLVAGPPRVRAFAANGTLLNRVLVQLWPLAVALLLTSPPRGTREVRRPSLP